MAVLPPLTVEQTGLADRRAHCLIAAAEVLDARAVSTGAFVSIRQSSLAARQAGTSEPDPAAEKAMVRSAGIGRFAAAGVLGDWQWLLGAAHEAARWHREPLDVVGVSRLALAWCLADRPPSHAIAALLGPAREIMAEASHAESPQRPYLRQTLDGWRSALANG